MTRLTAFRGRTHLLTTAVALVGGGWPEELFSVDTRVRFRADVTDAELRAYIAHGEARGCAGGYMVEQRGVWLIETIDGDWTNVVGLPVFDLVTRLRKRGFRLLPDGTGCWIAPEPEMDAPR
jgi:septum formation protein